MKYQELKTKKELPRCPHCGLNGAELVKMGWIGHWTKEEGMCAKCKHEETLKRSKK